MKKNKTTEIKRITNILYNLVSSVSFKNDIQKIRYKFGISQNGLERIDLPLLDYAISTKYSFYKKFKVLSDSERFDISRQIDTEVMELCDKYGFHHFNFIFCISPFVFLNNITKTEFSAYITQLYNEFGSLSIESCSLCLAADFISDSESYREDYSYRDSYLKQNHYPQDLIDEYEESYLLARKNFQGEVKNFPILLQISSNASINQIISYIRGHKSEIKELQLKNQPKNRNYSTRTRITHEKYKFIYDNRGIKPRSSLAQLVNGRYYTNHDAIYIRNILSKMNHNKM